MPQHTITNFGKQLKTIPKQEADGIRVANGYAFEFYDGSNLTLKNDKGEYTKIVPDSAVKGPFAVTLEGGTIIKVWDSSGGEGAGIVTIGSWNTIISSATFPVQTGQVYLDVVYTGGTSTAYSVNIRIAATTPSPSSLQQYILRLGGCTVTGGTSASVYQTRAPGDIEVLGRWTL